MTQSGCIYAPGENTQSMYQNSLRSALCNQPVQMLTFPPLTSISMPLRPAAQSWNNSNDRRATERSIGAESVWAFPAKESKGRKICARAAALTEECDAQERAQTGRQERGRSVYSPGGGGPPVQTTRAILRKWKLPSLQSCTPNPFHFLLWLAHYLLFPQLAPGPSFPAYLHI